MRDFDAFGFAGRTRCVNDVSEIASPNPALHSLCSFGRDLLALLIHTDHLQATTARASLSDLRHHLSHTALR